MTFEEAIEIIEEVDGEVGAIGYIIKKLQETYAPKLQIPKRMAEIIDTDGLDSDNEDLDYWIIPNISDGKEDYRRALCEIYVASKVIGIELIEVVE